MSHAHIIDKGALLRRFKGNQQIADDMLYCFRDNIPALMNELHRHVTGADQTAMMATAQKIFNLAASSSALALENIALQMKHAATMGNMTSAQNIMPLLEQQALEAIAAINAAYPQSEILPQG